MGELTDSASGSASTSQTVKTPTGVTSGSSWAHACEIGESRFAARVISSNERELHAAEAVIEKVNQSKLYKNPVVTSLETFKAFYSAEDYHQDYLQKHPGGYTCHYVRSDKSLL